MVGSFRSSHHDGIFVNAISFQGLCKEQPSAVPVGRGPISQVKPKPTIAILNPDEHVPDMALRTIGTDEASGIVGSCQAVPYTSAGEP